jgi:uncharacterized Ntn-hydrolase superfamily protein
MKKTSLVLTFILATFATFNAYATWSVIAVDRATGEIGIVGASCTFDVQGIASIVPGKGAIVVQASSNYFARMKGVELMNKNSTPEHIIAAMRDKKFEPEKQQYGVITLNKETVPLVYSGTLIKDWNGSKTERNFAVLGNILVGEKVIKNAFDSLKNSRGSLLSERLMLALKAGEHAGGDKRCGPQYARSAFISVYDPKDGAILKLSVHGIEQGGQPAVSLLNKQFENLNRKSIEK